jgi:hypothetical protein
MNDANYTVPHQFKIDKLLRGPKTFLTLTPARNVSYVPS